MNPKNFYSIALCLLFLIIQIFLHHKFIKFLVCVFIFSPAEQIISTIISIYIVPRLLDLLPIDIVFEGFWRTLRHPRGIELPYKLNFFLEDIYVAKIRWICISSIFVVQLGLFKAEIGNFFWYELARILCIEAWQITCFSGRPHIAALILGICGISALRQLILSIGLFLNYFSLVHFLLLFMSCAELMRSIPSISRYFSTLFFNYRRIIDFFNERR